MRTWVMLIFIPLLSMMAAADEKFVNAGPYHVSFDMGPIGRYNVEVNQSWLDEGKLDLHIVSGNNFIGIFGYPDKNGDFVSQDAKKYWIDQNFNQISIATNYYKRTIDGQDGLLGVGGNGKIFEALYSKEINGFGNILIDMVSTTPWDQGTENLLNSIKIDYTPTSTSSYGIPLGTSTGTEGANYGTPYGTSTGYGTSRSDIAKEIRSPYFKGNRTSIVSSLANKIGNLSY